MSITAQEIQELSLLARLHLAPDELERMTTDLGAVLAHFAELASVDTDGVAPMTHAIPMDLRLRADEVKPSLTAQEALRGAPKRDGDLFLVPAIIPGGE